MIQESHKLDDLTNEEEKFHSNITPKFAKVVKAKKNTWRGANEKNKKEKTTMQKSSKPNQVHFLVI